MRKIIFTFFLPLMLYCNPKEGNIVFGKADISEENNQLKINQLSEKAIINWQEFSIDHGQMTIFNLPSSSSSILNRVSGNNISKIYGSLKSNGKVFLINQKGILIGENGSINTNGFVVSTLDIENENYLSNKDYPFESNFTDSQIENFGIINGLDNDVIIIAPIIKNSGVILSKTNDVKLLSSTKILLKEDGKSSIVKTDLSYIENKGSIEAVQIELKASNNNIYALAINEEGIIKTKGFERKDGRIILSADLGEISIKGTLESTSLEKGGEIQILADYVNIKENSKIDASSEKDGGTILIGGDFQGENENIKNAKFVYVEKNTSIDASSKIDGNGGKVILWSDEGTWFHGNINVKGGKEKGDGGFVEISSKGILDPIGNVYTSAASGKAGQLLLDPTDVTISTGVDTSIATPPPPPLGSGGPYNYTYSAATATINSTSLQNFLNDGNVTITTGPILPPPAGSGIITINNNVNITWSAPTQLKMIANRNILFTGSGLITISNTATTGSFIDGEAIHLEALGTLGTPAGNNFTGLLLGNPTILSTIHSTTGQGNIFISGKGGTTGGNVGVSTLSSFTPNGDEITTVGGNITLVGTGAAGLGNALEGVLVIKSCIKSTGTGSINMTGTGGNANTNNNYGVAIQACNLNNLTGSGLNTAGISTNMGSINITGTGGSSTGNVCFGVYLLNATGGPNTISSNGSITITGFGNSLTAGNGCQFDFGNSILAIGDISISGKALKTSATSFGLNLVAATITGKDNNDIILRGESPGGIDINLQNTILVTSGDIILYNDDYIYFPQINNFVTPNSLEINPLLPTSPIGIGDFATGTLTINDTVLQNLFSNDIGSIVIGNDNGTHLIQVGTISSIPKPLILYGQTLQMLSGDNTWRITDNNSGSITSSIIGGTLYFNGFQNLTGGTGNDIFILSDQKGISGTVDGGGGFNTLDYSDYTTPVYVNLTLGMATNIGHILNIQNVIFNQVKLTRLFFTLLFNTFYLKNINLDDYDYMYDNHTRYFIRLKKIIWNKMFDNILIESSLKNSISY